MSNVRTYEWAQVDVFAERALEGNMLAIFPDARGLNDEEMQALARETNLSETTFVLPGEAAEDRLEGVRVRIFTVAEELPFAGHPTLGTAAWLRLFAPAFAGAEVVKLRLKAGTIWVRFTAADGGPGVHGTMRQLDPQFGALLPDGQVLAHALGLSVGDLHPKLQPQVVSTGLPFAVVCLRDVEALSRVRVNAAALEAVLAGCGAAMATCVAPTDHPLRWRARVQFYGGEDPATGSAAGCAISLLVRHGAVPSGARAIIEQGQEVRRPSRIEVSARLEDGRVLDVEVGGRTVPVAAGRFTLA